MKSEREGYVTLNMITGLGPVRVRSLIETLGSVLDIFRADEFALMGAEGVGRTLAATIVAERERIDPAKEIDRAAKMGITVVTPADADYPASLRELHDPPLALYLMGSLDEVDRRAIAIVGTRQPTHYGISIADRLAYQLGKIGITVISGLARGIDTAAHKGALKAGGRTVAVIGSGFACLYPPENQKLAQQISEQGAVISEYPLDRQPDRTTFPYRNRIISGLSMGVLVVEAGLNSGALHTAYQALDQGKLVFAVPGRVDSPSSRGCHKLLKQGAKLVEDLDDVLAEFEFLLPPSTLQKANGLDPFPRVALDEKETKVVKALWSGPADVDSLIRETGVSVGEMASLLIKLEMKKVVRMLPGRCVELTQQARDIANKTEG